jgi:hypothetical protein
MTAKHSFKLVGAHAIHVLARLAAKNAVKDQMRGEGTRMTLVPPRVIAEKACAFVRGKITTGGFGTIFAKLLANS